MTADRSGLGAPRPVHRLDPLLAPRSIAFVGASTKKHTPGNDMLLMIARAGFTGAVFAVNPNYAEVEGRPCYPTLAALPQPVDLVVLSVANARIEAALREAIDAGARAAVIFASLYLENDADPPLIRRVTDMARAAGMPICGGNGMGFYNDTARVWAAAFDVARSAQPGGITFISQSGSPYGALAHNDPRFRFNLVVSAGQELVTSAADYLDYALEQPETRVVGLFLETVRDPAAFVAALDKARHRQIPVVALKVGRTEASAAMALTHTGAIAGDDATYRALFDRYGVLPVDTLDELAACLSFFDQPRRAAPGGLVAIHDSGGERELAMDLAAGIGVNFTRIGPTTVARLRARLEHGLAPVNPLDAWGTGHDFVDIFAECFSALVDDPDAALGLFFNDLRDDYYVHEGFAEAARRAHARTGKPVAYASNFSLARHPKIVAALGDQGVPVLVGTVPALVAARNMMAYRDVLARPPDPPVKVRPQSDWPARLRSGGPLDEADGLALLADYGIPSPPREVVESELAALEAARRIGFPAVLKTAMPGIRHKTEQGGVRLGISDAASVGAAYQDLASRLGPRVLVTRMAPAGVELAFGVTADPQFGPVVMVAAGGIWIEVLRDAGHALAPCGLRTARRLIDGLRIRILLGGLRGTASADLDALASALARFSVLAADLADEIAAIDVNPIVATANGVLALDALVVSKAR